MEGGQGTVTDTFANAGDVPTRFHASNVQDCTPFAGVGRKPGVNGHQRTQMALEIDAIRQTKMPHQGQGSAKWNHTVPGVWRRRLPAPPCKASKASGKGSVLAPPGRATQHEQFASAACENQIQSLRLNLIGMECPWSPRYLLLMCRCRWQRRSTRWPPAWSARRGWVVKQAPVAWLEQEEQRSRLTLEAPADVDAGAFIDHSAVQAWAASLDTDSPLPAPQ